jgi:hypothetical protein
MTRWFLIVAACGACGSSAPPVPAPVGPPAALVAAPAPGDAIVARVNGRPVFASCVAAQGRGKTVKAGLDDCVAFELMAQEAERRGDDRDRDVVLATKTALVSKLVATTYEDTSKDPAALPDWQKFLDKWQAGVKHEQYRASTYVRVPVPAKAPADADAQARALAEQIAAALAPERGLMSAQVRAIVERITPALVKCRLETTTPCYDDIDPFAEGGLEEHYGPALFAIPEVGRASPVVRTKWGWDIIIWTEDVPATNPPPGEIADKLLPLYKQSHFGTWVREIEKSLGVKVELGDVQALLGGSP